MTDKFQPTREQKIAGLEHIIYEINQFNITYKYPSLQSWFIDNAILESRLLHARNLIEFFTLKRINTRINFNEDNICAEDYEYELLKTDLVSQQEIIRLNKQLSHLTYSRTSDINKKSWPMDIWRPLEKEIERFITHLYDKKYLPLIDKTKIGVEINSTEMAFCMATVNPLSRNVKFINEKTSS